MTKLTDLSEQELADLLDLPLDKARKWLEAAKSISDEEGAPGLKDVFDLFGDFESATSLRRSSVEELMGLSAEEVERLKRTGEFYRRYPHFKRKAPKDADTRLRYLRELLGDEVEFEARYPAAYGLLFDRSRATSGLPLPSFGVRVLRSAPQGVILPAGWSQDWKLSQDSSDAFSISFARRTEGDNEVDQDFAPLDLGYMKGILLAVLGREEYAERIATELHDESVREELSAPAQSPVRLTDLRLATALKPQDPTSLEKELLPLLQMLERPITPDEIRQWKWDLLWKTEQMRGRSSEETEASIVRVSFAAAALLLFLDLGMPGLADASEGRLAKQIGDLADVIRKLSKSLNANANKLEKLLAYRAQNRPSTPGQEFYEALVAYRMGKEIESVAEDLRLTPYVSSPSDPLAARGTKHWKSRLAEKLEHGAEIEQEKHPLAVAIFKNRHKSRVQAKARLAYRSYSAERQIALEEEDKSPLFKAGDRIHVSVSADSGLEVVQAYVQLGSCLERELEPSPTRSDFDS